MQNHDLPDSIRILMAETYLSALMNLTHSETLKYINNHSKTFERALRYIIETFYDSSCIQKGLEEVLKMVFNLEETEV